MIPGNEPSGENIRAGFYARYQLPFRSRLPDDGERIDDDWLRSEGHVVHQTNGVVVSLDGEDPQIGTVLVRVDEGWLFESAWPELESVMLVPQPKTRGDLRRAIAIFVACRRSRGALDIFDALHIGFTTHGDTSPSI